MYSYTICMYYTIYMVFNSNIFYIRETESLKKLIEIGQPAQYAKKFGGSHPTPWLGDPKPKLRVLKPKLRVLKPRLGDPKPRPGDLGGPRLGLRIPSLSHGTPSRGLGRQCQAC